MNQIKAVIHHRAPPKFMEMRIKLWHKPASNLDRKFNSKQFCCMSLAHTATYSKQQSTTEKGCLWMKASRQHIGGMEKKMSFNFRSFALAFAHPFLQHQQPLIIQTLGRTIEIDFGQYWTFPTYLWQKESRSPQGSDSERKFWLDRSSKWVFRGSCSMWYLHKCGGHHFLELIHKCKEKFCHWPQCSSSLAFFSPLIG